MTNDEAKFILGAYRANGRDAENAVFTEALRRARVDPALGTWLARAQAHDAAISAKLREVTPPAGLREAILAGARASRTPTRRWTGYSPWWLAAAAVIVVALTVTVGLRQSRAVAEATRFSNFALDDTAHAQHGGHGAATGTLAAVLSEPSTRIGDAVPVDFAKLRATGCRTVSFAGHDVLEVCFQRDGRWFHCYIANRSDFPRMAARASAVFAQHAQLASAAWSDATHHFVIVGEGGIESIKRLL